MEATRLIDPSFWSSAEPAAPGSELPDGVNDPIGLVWFQTSGSTGRPRWIGHSREGLLLSAAVVNRHLGVTEDDVWGLALPLHHVGGFGVVARAFESGCRLESDLGKWEPGQLLEWLKAVGVTHLSLVPTQVHDLVRLGVAPPPSVRAVVVGGGCLDQSTGQAARDLGWPVLASYGMTEAASQIATQGEGELRCPYQMDGLPVLPHWEVESSDDGILRLKGPSLFVATLEASEGRWKFAPRDDDWFETQDRVKMEAGRLTMLGRVDRVVKVLGELVDLAAVERAIGLEGVAVVAAGDDRNGARLVAYSEVDDGQRAVERYNGGVAGPWKVSACVRVESLPRSELGKVRYAELG
ncbi:MAG: AMP-binding protein [Haloferula sp.]